MISGMGMSETVGIIPLATLTILSSAALVYAFFRLTPKAEAFVSLFWFTVAINATVFSQVTISGLLYPFYLGLLLILFLRLFLGGLRFDPRLLWLIAGFLFVVMLSFMSTTAPVDHDTFQTVIAMLLCPAIVLALGARVNLAATTAAAVAASTVIAVWVWVSAARGGFQYRGNIPANENDAAFMLGLGLVVTIALALGLKGRSFRTFGPTLVLLSVLMTYALILLASRGMTVAFGIALAGMLAHLIRADYRKLWVVGLVIAMGAVSITLPGGDGIIKRFEGESLESAGDRTPIWQATLESYADGTPFQILLGHGFEASRLVVRAATGTLSSTHNTGIAILYNFGAMGLLLFLAVHAFGLVQSFLSPSPAAIVATGLLWFLLGSGLTSAAHASFMYWIALGVALALATHSQVVQTLEAQPDRLAECAES